MPKLTDIQILLLTTAANRPDGSLLPPPDGHADLNARVRKSITALIGRGLVEEKTVTGSADTWQTQGDQHLGIFITEFGREAVGLPTEETPPKFDIVAQPVTKLAIVVDMLRRGGGATVAELNEATGWQPHTLRAALTRLRQKGHAIGKDKRDGATAYLIAAAA